MSGALLLDDPGSLRDNECGAVFRLLNDWRLHPSLIASPPKGLQREIAWTELQRRSLDVQGGASGLLRFPDFVEKSDPSDGGGRGRRHGSGVLHLQQV